jgi:Ethanolamine utilization protein EutJ (predicted chaperonin)
LEPADFEGPFRRRAKRHISAIDLAIIRFGAVEKGLRLMISTIRTTRPPFDSARAALVAFSVLAVAAVATSAEANEKTAAGDYEIVKATADKVWRLNRRTGEIAVCGMEGTRLVCAVAQETTGGRPLSAEELETRRKLAAEAEQRRREDEMKKDLAFMDRMIALFREFVKAAMERETASAAPK